MRSPKENINRARRRRFRIIEALMGLIVPPQSWRVVVVDETATEEEKARAERSARITGALESRLSRKARHDHVPMKHVGFSDRDIRSWIEKIQGRIVVFSGHLKAAKAHAQDLTNLVRSQEFRIAGDKGHPAMKRLRCANTEVRELDTELRRFNGVLELLQDEQASRVELAEAINGRLRAIEAKRRKAEAEAKADQAAWQAEVRKMLRPPKPKAPVHKHRRTVGKGLEALKVIKFHTELITKTEAVALAGSAKALANIPIVLEDGRRIVTVQKGAVTRYAIQSR